MTGAVQPGAGAPPPGPLTRGLRLGFDAAAMSLRALGPARHPLAGAGGMVGWALDRRRRQASVANHLRLGAPTVREARRRSRASFRHYAQTSVDFLWAMGMSKEDVLRHSRLHNGEYLEATRAAGRGGVLAMAHFGNWDFAAMMAWAHGLDLTTVMAPIGNRTITDLVLWARQRNAMEAYPPERAARGLLRALGRGRFAALLCDIPGAGPETVVRYCGGPVTMSLSPAWLAMRCGVPLIPVDCRRGGRGEPTYVATAHPPLWPQAGEDAAALTQRLATALEAPVRRRPEQWYPFRQVYSDSR